MFVVTGIEVGTCIACGRETECLQVQGPRQGLAGPLCLPDFRKLVRIATAAPARPPEKVAERPPQGTDEGPVRG